MNIDIRSAKPDDAPFLAWVMLTAARSHLAHGIWERYVGGTERDCLTFLESVACTEKLHLFHSSTFIVAEVNGRMAGGLSGYDPQKFGMKAFTQAVPEVHRKLGWTEEYQKEAIARYIPWTTCTPENIQGAWVVENVATVPEFRRQGIINVLLTEIIEIGHQKGFKKAQIGVMIGNTPARNAYEKSGFMFVDEKRNPDFMAAIGSPGITRLVRKIA